MSFKGSTVCAGAFAVGKAKKSGVNQSTGVALYCHGNKIAEWRDGLLYVSNGGFQPNNGATGSKTTKDKLNALPGVYVSQKAYKWYLNGKEWGGSEIVVDGVVAPEIDTVKAGEVFDLTERYHRMDGWRGWNEPLYAAAGANDTGTYSDSPCPTPVAMKELGAVEELLKSAGINVKRVTKQTSNIFCVAHFLVPMVKHVSQARAIVNGYLEANETRLLYVGKAEEDVERSVNKG